MAGERDLLSRVRATAALLDDAALAALSNRGLVRRARKDAERTPPVLEGVSGDRVRLTMEGQTILVAERPAESRCSCPATGICRHIVTALVLLAQQGAAATAAPSSARGEPVEPRAGSGTEGERAAEVPGPVPSAGDELLEISDEALRRWAGRAALDRAIVEAASGTAVAFEEGPALIARMRGWNAECRFLPGAGVEGALCTCHAPGACPHKLVAIVAWQAKHGRRDLAAAQAVLAEAEGAPRTREEVRASVVRTLEELVGVGLSRLSPAAEGRLRTLATSAHGVDLPRLERLVRAVADEISAWLARDARASSGALLGRAAQALALAEALARPAPALVGRHRTRHDRVGDLDLVGLGARAWRSASGYTGLTVYFWDVGGAGWATWTDARPLGTAGFDPVARFRAPGPWTGCASPAQAAGSRLRLMEAFRSATGRLSGREATRMLAVGKADPAIVPAVNRWPELVPRAWAALGPGLGERAEQAEVAVLAPAGWGRVAFDAVRQELWAEVLDADGRALPLVLRHADGEEAIRALEAAAQAPPPPALLALLRIARGRLAATPVSLVSPERVVSLGLSAQAAAPAAAPVAPPGPAASDEEDAPDEGAADAGEDAAPTGALGRLLLSAWTELERLAEAGCAAPRRPETLAALAARAEASGLGIAGRALRRLAEATAAPTDDPAERLRRLAHLTLRAAYSARATETAAALEAATAGYR